MTEDIDDIEAPVEKTFVRSVRLKPSEWAEVQRRAERAGMLVNSYVVWACTRAPERADIRDETATLALSDGEGVVAVGSAADVQDAAQAVVIDDDGDALLAVAEAAADAVYGDVATPVDPVAMGAAMAAGVISGIWPDCGHPNVPENRTKRGPGRPDACRICRNAATRESRKRVKERKAQST